MSSPEYVVPEVLTAITAIAWMGFRFARWVIEREDKENGGGTELLRELQERRTDLIRKSTDITLGQTSRTEAEELLDTVNDQIEAEKQRLRDADD